MLEGDLSDFTLPEILKLLAFTTKTGRLYLRHDGTLARVEVGAGRVQAASADAAHLPLARRLIGRGLVDTDLLQELIRDTLPTDLELAHALVDAHDAPAPAVTEAVRAQSVDAMFDLLRWTEGRFEFVVEDVPSSDALAVDHELDELLEQARHRLQRWADIHERTGPGDASVSVTSPADPSVEIDADAWQLIGLADGSRTIDDLARLTGRGQFDTRSTLLELADRGLVAFGTGQRDGALERLLRAQSTLGELEQRLGGSSVDDGSQRTDGREDDAAADKAPAMPDAPVDVPVLTDASDALESATMVAELELDTLDGPGDDDEAESITPAATVAGAAGAGSVARRPRLRTDPSVDPALVDRLIDGVRNLA